MCCQHECAGLAGDVLGRLVPPVVGGALGRDEHPTVFAAVGLGAVVPEGMQWD